uniref:Uncharacterized protein n=1 Tax=Sphaerodactylus townsendi TaxID=933632 RepID=A0ACB8FVM1_9SAUR
MLARTSSVLEERRKVPSKGRSSTLAHVSMQCYRARRGTSGVAVAKEQAEASAACFPAFISCLERHITCLAGSHFSTGFVSSAVQDGTECLDKISTTSAECAHLDGTEDRFNGTERAACIELEGGTDKALRGGAVWEEEAPGLLELSRGVTMDKVISQSAALR